MPGPCDIINAGQGMVLPSDRNPVPRSRCIRLWGVVDRIIAASICGRGLPITGKGKRNPQSRGSHFSLRFDTCFSASHDAARLSAPAVLLIARRTNPREGSLASTSFSPLSPHGIHRARGFPPSPLAREGRGETTRTRILSPTLPPRLSGGREGDCVRLSGRGGSSLSRMGPHTRSR